MFAKLVGRKEEKIGDVSLLSFIGVVLSRLGYYTNINFLNVYLETFGDSKIIPTEILTKYGSMIDNDSDLFSDELLLEGLTIPASKPITFSKKVQGYIHNPAHAKDVQHANIVNTHTTHKVNYPIFEKKDANDTQKILYKHIDFYDMAKKINLLNTAATKGKVFEIEEKEQKEENGQTPYTPLNQSDVKYYSISNKSYGGNFILADKRIKNAIFVIFRGTYSAKSAGSYTKPESLFPQKAKGSDSEYLSGISNLNYAVLHSIMISISKLIDFLGQEKIQVITCGHSLGGGLATTFSNIFNERIQEFIQKLPNLKALKNKIYVISVAAPRVLSSKTSETYCKKISEGQIFYRRIDTRGDPVPNLPPSGSAEKGFRHPCELGKDKPKDFNGKKIDNKENHENIYRQITGALTKDLNINYNENVDAANYNRRARGTVPSVYLPNPLKHTTYLKIKFTNAVDLKAFAKSALPSFAKSASSQSEVSNTKGESV